jgi:hypothetical protein
VSVTFVFNIPARKGIDVGEMIHHAPAGLQNDFIATIGTDEWPMRLRRKICGDGFAGEFSLGAKHWWECVNSNMTAMWRNDDELNYTVIIRQTN